MSVQSSIRFLTAGIMLAASASLVHAQQRARPNVAPAQDPLRFQFLGPVAGGRISAVAGVVGDPTTWYMGAASGGVWKSTDSGSTYAPVFDSQPVQAIGALAVAPSNPSYRLGRHRRGVGDPRRRRHGRRHLQVHRRRRDVDEHRASHETGRIGRIIMHPDESGHRRSSARSAARPARSRSAASSARRDGGKTWQRVLFVDERHRLLRASRSTPNDPNVLFAGTWEVVMHTWAMFSGGAGQRRLRLARRRRDVDAVSQAGLPKSPVGKIDVAVAPSNSKRVYALIQTANQGSLWRSDDGGTSWKVVSWDRTLIGRAGYYIRIEVNPRNENEVLVANSSFHRSTGRRRSRSRSPAAAAATATTSGWTRRTRITGR